MIVNPASRQGRLPAAEALEVLSGSGIRIREEPCAAPAEVAAAIRRCASAVDLVVLGGGDGTLHAAAAALIETGLPFGILPLGTANDLARTLDIPPDPVAAARVITEGEIRRIDLGEVNGKPFFNVASLGLSVRMTRELTHDVKRRWGRLGYGIATVRALWRMRPFWVQIRYDGHVHTGQTLQVAVGNGRFYGGGMAVEERARIDDACLNVYSLEFDRLWKLALIYPAFRRGRHGMWKEVRTATCTEVEVRTHRPRPVNADGELVTHTPAHFRVLPQAIAVYVPRGARRLAPRAAAP